MCDPEFSDEIDTAFLHSVTTAADQDLSSPSYDDVRFARWLEYNTRRRQSLSERASTAESAVLFAQRVRTKIHAAQIAATLAPLPLQVCAAGVVGTIAQVGREAMQARCAPWLETLAVAAGYGRELWDESCERWVELPKGVARAEHVALSVAGDSMVPVLTPGDVLLVRTGAAAKVGALVVALHPDHGYVVKYVARISANMIELESFNPEYSPLHIANNTALILGVVSRIFRPSMPEKPCN